MQQVYIKRMTKQDITRSVAICTESVEPFWDLSLKNTTDYTDISVCHVDRPNYFPSDITIHKGYGGEKDWRICGNDWKKLYADDNPQEGDMMIVRKIGYRRFSIQIAKRGSSEYVLLSTFFSSKDNYVLLSTDDALTQKPTEPETLNVITKESPYRPFITAIKSKPFLLLAGISGTGKSRIVRELARACWDTNSEEYKAQKPRNFEMVQVKPNWHDSSELIGYVSRIDGVRYVVGPFLKFMVKATQDPETPYFLCLDEMNLAPVEQYFAEYLSVIESRKRQEDGTITTDPIIDYSNTDEYYSLISQLFPDDDNAKAEYLTEEGGKRLSIPQNLIVVGTVNMDETTFSFSRKVLDRAMTIEMNEVDLTGGLSNRYEQIGKLGAAELIGNTVEGVDLYSTHKAICDKAIKYLQTVNDKLEGTPFKIAYRTRNEALLYVVNNLPYIKNAKGDNMPEDMIIARALDEITNMKILTRIEGDESKVSSKFLEELGKTIKEGLKAVFSDESEMEIYEVGYEPISLAKLEEMKKRLSSGYTSFWS